MCIVDNADAGIAEVGVDICVVGRCACGHVVRGICVISCATSTGGGGVLLVVLVVWVSCAGGMMVV